MKTKIQIKSIFGDVLFEYETEENTIKKTLEYAVKERVDLRDSDLRVSNLSGSDLSGSDLSYSNLRGIKAKKIEDLSVQFVNSCSRDMLFVFQHLKEELPFLRKMLIEGKVDGTQYEGECACLIGTMANAKQNGDRIIKVCQQIPYYDKGTHNMGETWFLSIHKGDTPENSIFAKHAVDLIDEVMKDEPNKTS